MNQSQQKRTKASYLIFILAAVVLVCFRMILKLDFIDPQTGFYNTHSVLNSAFAIVYAVFCLALLLFSYSDKENYEKKLLPPLKTISPLATIFGMAIEAKALTDGYELFNQIKSGEQFKTMDLLLNSITVLVSVVTGIVMIVLAVNMGTHSLKGYPSSIVLAITVLYQCLMLIERFTKHTSPITISDDMLEMVMLVFGILFMMAHARVITQLNLNKGYRLLQFSGYAFALTALILLLPELFGILIGRLEFEPAQTTVIVYDIFLMLYCIVFTRKVTH